MSALLDVRSINVRQWTFSICTLLVAGALALVVTMPSARAHGIAGNRLFPGTLSFSEGTFHDASADEVAERASIARATLYLHFPSRLDLIDAVDEPQAGR